MHNTICSAIYGYGNTKVKIPDFVVKVVSLGPNQGIGRLLAHNLFSPQKKLSSPMMWFLLNVTLMIGWNSVQYFDLYFAMICIL